jgi:hypothetical protein
MAKAPALDEATLRIARTLLSTRPKPHEEMKLGEGKAKVKASHKGKSAPRKSKSGEA